MPWEQASHSGHLVHAVEAGAVKRDDVTELGTVLAGTAQGAALGGRGDRVRFDRPRDQDLAMALAALERLDALDDVPVLEL